MMTDLRRAGLDVPIGSQTWPHRAKLRSDFPAVLSSLAAIGVQEIELCSPFGYEDFARLTNGAEVRRMIADHGLECRSGHFMRDLRLAIRSLRATPIVTCAAVLSLVLGIGANTSIFSLFDSLLLRPLPVARPDRLVMLSMGQTEDTQFSYALLEQLRRLDQFDGATAWNVGSKGTLTIAGDTRTVDTQFVSGEYFNLLGVPAVVGRTLLPSDDTDGGGPNGLVAMYGKPPSLSDLVLDGNLENTTDFRQVYGTLVEWMGADSAKVLGRKFTSLGVFKA